MASGLRPHRSAALVAALLVLSSAAVAADSPPEPEVAETPLEASYRALLRPRVSGVFASAATIRVGRAEIVPAAGTKLRRLAALEAPCGVLVDGPARLIYRIEERHSVPIALRNLKGLRALDVESGDGTATITAAIDHAAIWSRELAEALGATTDDAEPLPGWLATHLEKQFGPNPARDVLLSERNGEPGYAMALFESGGDVYGIDVDPRPHVRLEALLRYEQLESAARPYGGRRFAQELAAQPIGRRWTDAVPPSYVVTATAIDLVNDRDLHVTTRSKLRIEAKQPLAVVPFSFWSDVAREQRRNSYRVTRLAVDGAPATFVHHEDTLLVELPRSLEGGGAAEIEVEADGEILERPEAQNYWLLGYAPWTPRAHGGWTRSSYTVRLEVPQPYVPFASGTETRRSSEGGRNVVETFLPGPAEAAVLLAGKYEVLTENRENGRLEIATFLDRRDKEAKKLADLFFSLRDCHESWLDTPYPFRDLRLLEINDWGWGQAPPGVIFITKEAFMNRARAGGEGSEEIARLTGRGVHDRFAHEIAHGYFPHTAMTASAEDSWLSESFADYVSAVCVERSSADRKEGARRFAGQMREWKSFDRETDEGVSVHLVEHLSGRDDHDARDRRHVLYGRGPLVLHALRADLARHAGEDAGEKQFFAFVREYVTSFRGKTARTADLVDLLRAVTGRDYGPWFERFVYGYERPPVD